MKIFLIWLTIATGADGGIETHVYETEIVGGWDDCIAAQTLLVDKLIDEGYRSFTAVCEKR